VPVVNKRRVSAQVCHETGRSQCYL
jgi:hypothetical protein